MRRIPNYMFIMDVLPYMLLLLFMLFDASSELLFNMLVVVVVMSNILELIMNLLPNSPTWTSPVPSVYGFEYFLVILDD